MVICMLLEDLRYTVHTVSMVVCYAPWWSKVYSARSKHGGLHAPWISKVYSGQSKYGGLHAPWWPKLYSAHSKHGDLHAPWLSKLNVFINVFKLF